MAQIKTILACIIIMGLASSCKKASQKPAHLRIGQFLIMSSDATIKIEQNNRLIREETLSYPTLTGYNILKPGRYTVTVSTGNTEILSKEYGMGQGEYFTLCMFGIPDTTLAVNYQTTKDKLHTIFAGAEAHTANGQMPKFEMLIDNFQKGKDEAQIRWMHLAPGLKALVATAVKQEDTHDLSKADYAQTIDDKALPSGKYTFSWKVDGSPRKSVAIEKQIDPENIYTFFVLGNIQAYSDSLQVLTGITKKNK